MKKSLLLISSMILLATSACSSAATTTPSSGNANTPAAKAGEQVKVSLWDYNSSEATVKALTKLIEDYQKEHPNVKIERTYVPFADIKNKLLLGSAAGQLPDIVWIDNPDHQAFSASGILADISKEIKDWGQADKYFKGPWSSTMYKDKNYGVPTSSNNLALFYNADLLDAAEKKPPANWKELQDAAKKLTKSGVYGFAASAIRNEQGMFQFLPFIWQAGSDLNSFNTPGTVEALKLWKGMVDEGAMSKEVLTQDQQAVMLQFIAGKVSMVVNGTWQLPLVAKDAKFKWGVVPLPANKQGGTILGGENWAITSTSKVKDTAWDLIKYSQEPTRLKDYLIASGRLPSRTDMINDATWQNDKSTKVFADSMNVSKARAYGPNYPKISDAVQEMLQQVLTGVKSPEDAVKETETKIKPLLQ
ncbi:multiple sugar transport system substrate-binding protein [Paenibacillus sp. 1_12]|uniref:ABC transporter substrate-binding protein n=1 Tax=Paenibacillus sp. 1_12 TaxID=1566278 RepID=UPI0008E4C8C5|nr:sugar ABC transporter substrate-binding protein [Paenibacillus sp. 1_12]SFL55552.1 multiple sugar transport system substrate-binding protein [Paenibacillus sp. 1_12]